MEDNTSNLKDINAALGLENDDLRARCQALEELVQSHHKWCSVTAPYNYHLSFSGQELYQRKIMLLGKRKEQGHGQ